MIRAGELRNRAVFKKPVRSISSTGEESVTYTDLFTASVSFKALRGKMAEQVHQIAPEASHTIKMHYAPNRIVTEEMRAVIGDQEFDIVYVDNIMLKDRVYEIQVKQYKGGYGDQSGY